MQNSTKKTRAIAQLEPQFTSMPHNGEEMYRVATNFFEIADFPGVIGAVDCTHIRTNPMVAKMQKCFGTEKASFPSTHKQCATQI